jgi:ferredoxin-NADP reductase
MPEQVEVLYSTRRQDVEARDPNEEISSQVRDVLFSNRLLDMASNRPSQMQLDFFLTDGSAAATEAGKPPTSLGNVSLHHGKITQAGLERALGNVEERGEVVCYVCGPQKMTDHFVSMVSSAQGMSPERVLCEKWW